MGPKGYIMNNRNIRVSNSNGKKKGDLAHVRIYKNGNLVADVEMNQRDPLSYLQAIVNSSKYLDELSRQLRQHLSSGDGFVSNSELTLEDFEHLQSEYGLKVQIC